MNQFVFANNVQTALAAPITSPTQTTIELSSSANFPTIPPGYYWPITLNDAATQSFFEIVYVTSYSGNNLTVLRGQENTTARTWNTNDLAFSCATAGALASFLNAANANFVQLSPPVVQSGSINVSGSITGGSLVSAGGVSAGGPITTATTGSFSGDVTVLDLIASRGYQNTAIGNLPIRFNGNSTLIGMGPSSGLTIQGVAASALAIGAVSTGKFIAIDTLGNLGANDVFAIAGVFSNSVAAPQIIQNGTQVVDTITSSTLTISKVGHSVAIDIPSSGQIPVGGSIVNHGNGGDPTVSLPNYGLWFIEVIYAVTQTSNTNLIVTLNLIGGTITGGFVSNANGVQAFNSNAWITVYGQGATTVNNQTLTFGFSVSGGSIEGGTQPWTVRATRTG